MSITFKKFENKELNVSIDTHIDGKHNTWFKGKDVAPALGYKDTDKAIRNHVDGDYKCTLNEPPIWRGAKKTSTSEPGLYALILISKLDTAKKFQKWVFSQVLPSIRKCGYYRMFNNPKLGDFTQKY